MEGIEIFPYQRFILYFQWLMEEGRAKLSPSATKLFLYILWKLHRSGTTSFSEKLTSLQTEFGGMAVNTINKCMDELVAAGILGIVKSGARTAPDIYTLEPRPTLPASKDSVDPDIPPPIPQFKGIGGIKEIIRAVLFLSPKPVNIGQIFNATGIPVTDIRKTISLLRSEHSKLSVRIFETASGYSMGVAGSFKGVVLPFAGAREKRKSKLSDNEIEVLAIVCYKGPVSKHEIANIRGKDSSVILSILTKLGFVDESYNEDDDSLVFEPTKRCFDHLGIKGKEDLPSL